MQNEKIELYNKNLQLTIEFLDEFHFKFTKELEDLANPNPENDEKALEKVFKNLEKREKILKKINSLKKELAELPKINETNTELLEESEKALTEKQENIFKLTYQVMPKHEQERINRLFNKHTKISTENETGNLPEICLKIPT